GLLAQLKLPVDLTLDGVELDGELVVPQPTGGGEPERLHVTLTGGGLAAGHEGAFKLAAAEATNEGGALTLQADLGAAMDSPRTFSKLSAKANATASGPQFPSGVKLAIDATAARTAAGEAYTFGAAGAGKELASIHGEYSTATSNLSGQWKLDVVRSDVAAFALERALPEFNVVGQGSFESGGDLSEIHATGRLNASTGSLAVVREELGVLGALELAVDFDVLLHENSLRVDRFDATLRADKPVARVRALQPFEFDLRTAALKVADPAQDLVSVVLDGVPLAWARPWLGNFEVTGGAVRGEFDGSARNGGLELRAKQPLTINGLAVAQGGGALLRGIDVSLDAAADYAAAGWQVEVSRLTAGTGGVEFFSLDAKAGRLVGKSEALKVTGHFQANLAGWNSQPVFASSAALKSGTADGEFSGSIGGAKVLEAKVSLTNLGASAQPKLPAAHLECRLEFADDGKITFDAPLVVMNGDRTSDFAIGGVLLPGTPLRMDGRLTGDQVYVDDVTQLTALIPAGAPENGSAQPTVAATAKPDATPFWGALNGQVTLDLKKVTFANSLEVSNLSGALRLDPGSLKMDGLKAGFGSESDLKASGEVKFDAAAKSPYTLAADVAVANFETGPAFRALEPAKPPTIETKLNLTGHLAGAGADLGELTEHLRGEVQITGRGGIFRGLPVDLSDKLPKNQSAAAVIGGIIGAVTGKKETADNVRDLFSLAKTLSEIPFDQLSVKAVRGEDLNVQLQDFSLIAPELRLTGTGSVQHDPAKPLLQQPLNVQLSIGARGTTGDVMKRLKLLDTAKQDSLGYSAMVLPVTIGGSLEKPNVNQFATDLVKYVLERTGLLNSILGK
ncbi:MAG TPA: AsmA-like C-terminal region-containing protein, partial [Opitutus sp.]|nr:AsmA-like C-terminal region-containing protein [Opitutus sp.]